MLPLTQNGIASNSTDVIANYSAHYRFETLQSTNTTGNDIVYYINTTAMPCLKQTGIGGREVDDEYIDTTTSEELEMQGTVFCVFFYKIY
jgi:hypothetical protein